MLDRKKPFGTVFGFAGHSFEQDGKYFDNAGNEVGGVVAAKPSKPAKEVAKPATPLDAELDAQLKG